MNCHDLRIQVHPISETKVKVKAWIAGDASVPPAPMQTLSPSYSSSSGPTDSSTWTPDVNDGKEQRPKLSKITF